MSHILQFLAAILLRKGVFFLGAGIFFLLAQTPLLAATIEPLIIQEPEGTGEFPVFIFLDPLAKQTIGTDLLVSYDDSRVSYIKTTDGLLYEQYHPALHSSAKKTIRYSATNGFNTFTSSSGLFATMYFRKQSAAAVVLPSDGLAPAVQLIWKKDATDDTNVVSEDGTELLATAPAALAADLELASRLSGTVAGALTDKEWSQLRATGQLSDSFAYNLATSVGLTPNDPFRLIVGSVLVVGALGAALTVLFKKWRERRRAHPEEPEL